MPRQILTLRLDGITAGDYIAHISDPEPPALGFGLTSLTLRAEPLGDTLEAILEWEDCVPQPRVAAAAAGLPLTAEVVAVDATSIHAIPAPARGPALPEVRHTGRISAVIDRAAASLASRPWSPSVAPPLQLRWA